VLVVAGLALGIGVWAFSRPTLARRHDVAAWRALYRAFPVFPGATKVGERSFEIRDDDGGTGDYGLTITYRLSRSTTSTAVFTFMRRQLPSGWHEASDATCAGLAATSPPPPATPPPTGPGGGPVGPTTTRPASGADAVRLFRDPSELTVLAPGRGGMTFRFSAEGDRRLLTLDGVHLTCVPPGFEAAGR
ncbi:MAG: hypothetical protein ACRDZW_10905, partial [Acidimicrobiales bacterium]